MSKAIKTTLAVAAGVAAIAGAVSFPSLVSAWGDNGGGRPSYSTEEINKLADEGKWPKDKIVFNSIEDGNIGDEKNFVGARLYNGVNAGKKNVWNGNNITVEDGKEYMIRLYVHNNNPWGDEGVAKNTRVALGIPSENSTQIQVNGTITADNATPSKYWDYVNFNSKNGQAFHLEYVPGSALLENNGIGAGDGIQISDEIVTNASKGGTKIGYNSLNGDIPGCYGFASYVTIRVKAVYDHEHFVNTQVKVLGSGKEYTDSVEAKVGDKVQFQIEYKNIGAGNQLNVNIRSILPKNLRYVNDTTKLYNASHNGDYVVQNTVTTDGINVGGYLPNGNAFVRFTAEVVDDNLACGKNNLYNWGQAWVGTDGVQDAAIVVVNKTCTTPQPDTPVKDLPNTGPDAVIGGIVAAGSTVTAAGYYIASRRSLR